MRRLLQREKIGYQQDGGEGEGVGTAGEELACKVSGMRRLKVHFIVAWESLLFRCKDSCNSENFTPPGQIYIIFRQIGDYLARLLHAWTRGMKLQGDCEPALKEKDKRDAPAGHVQVAIGIWNF